MRKKLLLVYNPVSGSGGIVSSLGEVVSIFTEAGYDVTVHPTSEQGDGMRFISNCADSFDLVCTCGGDGMLHELICGIKDHDVKCGFIPTGTVNDFATSMQLPKKIPDAAKMIVEDNFRQIDAGEINGVRFAYIAAFGVFTEVSYSTSHTLKSALGSFAYFLEGLKRFDPKYFIEKSAHLEITCEDKTYEGDFSFGMAGNTLSVGGSKLAVPIGASMDDGLLDFMFVKTPTSIADYDGIRKALSDENNDNILRFRAEKISIKSDIPLDWDLDGEFGGSYEKADFSVCKHSVMIAAPSEEQ